MISYTFEVYRLDRRMKTGERLLRVFDLNLKDMATAEQIASDFETKIKNTVVKVFQTYTTKKTIFGKEYQERYDTPMCCSPATERFWTM